MPTIKLSERVLGELELPAGMAQQYYWDVKLIGLGVVVGNRSKTFVARARVGGKKRRVKIGIAGQAREDGQVWTVALARQRALELLGAMKGGIDPNAAIHARRGGPTLADGLKLHVGKMRKRNRSQESIDTIDREVRRHLADWLDRPVADLRGADLVEIHDEISADSGKHIANRIVRHVSAIWNSLDRVHEFEGRNPARAVEPHQLPPRREVVDDLPGWYARVQQLTPIRRDFQLVVAFTGMRSTAARTMRWEHIDWDRCALRVPKPKGGESRAFELPLSKTVIEALERRLKGNAKEMELHGGDHGWCFPSITRDMPHRVIHMKEAKERRVNDETGDREQFLPGPHVLRATFISVAAEAGISELDRNVLANHRYASRSVNETYIRQSWDHLQRCQATIEAALWSRINARPAPKLRAIAGGKGKGKETKARRSA